MIGQAHAKKVLSVAVYNHYKRLSVNLPQSQQASTPAEVKPVPVQRQYAGSPQGAHCFNSSIISYLHDTCVYLFNVPCLQSKCLVVFCLFCKSLNRSVVSFLTTVSFENKEICILYAWNSVFLQVNWSNL